MWENRLIKRVLLEIICLTIQTGDFSRYVGAEFCNEKCDVGVG